MSHLFPVEALQAWFLKNKRPFPWRENPTPYRVWISEVMLQQTQTSVVAGYFNRWMEKFPTVEALAKASIEEVLKTWEGLGYYSRAKHIHESAHTILHRFHGEVPNTEDKLKTLKGLGPYTCGAILSFAFHQKKVAIDGNVTRVLTRFLGVEGPIHNARVQKQLKSFAEAILPEKMPWLVVEGLIELGAIVCTKSAPNCFECPLNRHCKAHILGKEKEIPHPKPRPKTIALHRWVAIIEHEETFLIIPEREKKVMAGLYQFPYLEAQKGVDPLEAFRKALELDLQFISFFAQESHSFTRYKAHLGSYLFSSKKRDHRFLWKTKEEMANLPFSSGHRRILHHLLTKEF